MVKEIKRKKIIGRGITYRMTSLVFTESEEELYRFIFNSADENMRTLQKEVKFILMDYFKNKKGE